MSEHLERKPTGAVESSVMYAAICEKCTVFWSVWEVIAMQGDCEAIERLQIDPCTSQVREVSTVTLRRLKIKHESPIGQSLTRDLAIYRKV